MAQPLENITVAILEHRFTKEFSTLFERLGAAGQRSEGDACASVCLWRRDGLERGRRLHQPDRGRPGSGDCVYQWTAGENAVRFCGAIGDDGSTGESTKG